jgi:3-deoxy-D-manno-octulosonate 8-phosphate phosphatase (KDO 8-P phosphatase)
VPQTAPPLETWLETERQPYEWQTFLVLGESIRMPGSTQHSPSLRDRLAEIDWLILDVDGVLTTGRIDYGTMDGSAVEIKSFHVRDGSALVRWHERGKRTVVITGRSSPVVARRASELGITTVLQGVQDKATALADWLRTERIQPEKVAAMGDDLPDVPVLQQVGLAVAVADACPELRRIAHYITQARGGQAAVRETIERILRCQGLWERTR